MGWQVGIWIVVAVGVFWTVGAYNRLVSLRNALVRSFDPVDLQIGCAAAHLRLHTADANGVA